MSDTAADDGGVRLHRRLDGDRAIDLAIRRSGTGDGRPVLLVHGMGGDHTTWRRLASRLRDEGRPVVSYDQRGHGLSSRGPYGLDALRDDLLAVLAEAGPSGRVDVVAHSLGAHVALRAVMAEPDRFGRLVLEEVPPMPRDAADVAEGIAPRASAWEAVLGVVDLIRDPRPLMRFDVTVAPSVQAAFDVPDPDWWAAVAGVRSPVLVVSGGDRSFLPPRHLRTLAGTLPAGRFLTIDAGHSVHRDRPDPFTRAVVAFLRGDPVGVRD
ncbi:alpha/beta fold hydrolase [Williamsia deligens]|uniref:Alpha/beta fold hydrolase n=1 Tax=Williamsia deligens TaxID=321325 RepID=A0ABW3GE04_9NOCA|nr:alpha/beta hydrolase [Williamsia deligens]MCP2195949.1 Pimeloyl-ACP methyl ester carboxylesterase [Williamsia deligens]